jgi:hypothetical protein
VYCGQAHIRSVTIAAHVNAAEPDASTGYSARTSSTRAPKVSTSTSLKVCALIGAPWS